jgi:uncharacterized protein (TIGR02246 family)
MILLPLALMTAAVDTSPRAVVEATLAAINRHDAAALASLYADDAVVIASDSCTPSIGPEPVRRGHEALIRTMPDLTVEATDWVVEGDRVAILFTARSKALGPGGTMTLADFLTVRNGKIVRDVTIFNPGQPCR